MKNNFKTSLVFAVLSFGLNSAASAQDKPVDNTVKYTEKYVCTVNTTDEKTYLLDIEWSAEPAKYSQFPNWQEKLTYILTENSQQIDAGYFSDLGFGYSQTTFEFGFDKYVFTGHANQSTRVGTNSSAVQIEIIKTHDRASSVLSVGAFKASHIFDKFYGSVKEKTIELAIAGSECQVIAPSKQ